MPKTIRTSGGLFASHFSASCLSFRSTRAAARDDAEPIGKSPGFKSTFVTGDFDGLLGLFTAFSYLTVRLSNAHCSREPLGQSSVSSIDLQLLFAHPLKQLIQIDSARSVPPTVLDH
jgi:hypothetical protein